MKRFAHIILVGILACGFLTFIGCSTADIDNNVVSSDGQRLNRVEGTIPLPIPPELSAAEALDCIEKAISGTGVHKRKNFWVSQWRTEQRDAENRWMIIGLTARGHYLQVCYRVEQNQLVPDVPMSTGLKQTEDSIHGKVPVWINNLRPMIMSNIYNAAKAKRPSVN